MGMSPPYAYNSLFSHVARLAEDTPAHQALRCHVDLSPITWSYSCSGLETLSRPSSKHDVADQQHVVCRPGAVEFRRFTMSNFHGVEVVDWPVTPPSIFFHGAAVGLNVQFFDAILSLEMRDWSVGGGRRWWSQELKVDWVMWLNYFKDSEETVSGVCRIMSTGEPIPSLFRVGAHRVGGPGISAPGNFWNFWNPPRRNRRRKTSAPPPSEKNATRRRVSRIILASVVNASSRRRWDLRSTKCQLFISHSSSSVIQLQLITQARHQPRAKLHYMGTGYEHQQRTSSQQFYNKFATSQCQSPTSRHVKMLGYANFCPLVVFVGGVRIRCP